jgi:hypothetical protein
LAELSVDYLPSLRKIEFEKGDDIQIGDELER